MPDPNNEPEKKSEFGRDIKIPKRQEVKELYNKIPEFTPHTIYGADAATAANYGVFFIAPYQLEVLGFFEVHQTAGSDGSAVGLNLERLQGTEALDAGDELLSSDLSLKATANTVQEGTLTATVSNRILAKGDRRALKDDGTLTDLANVTVYVLYKPTANGHYRPV